MNVQRCTLSELIRKEKSRVRLVKVKLRVTVFGYALLDALGNERRDISKLLIDAIHESSCDVIVIEHTPLNVNAVAFIANLNCSIIYVSGTGGPKSIVDGLAYDLNRSGSLTSVKIIDTEVIDKYNV